MSSNQPPRPSVHYSASRYFPAWLVDQNASVVGTAYEGGMMFLIGGKPDGGLSCVERVISRPTGLAVSGNALWVGTIFQIWRFQNSVAPGEKYQGYDGFYVPRVAWSTGHVDVHDLGLDREGRPVFVNTMYSCLATVDDEYSFKPLWRPKFISALRNEDRCHLNGLAMVDGEAMYVTCIGRSDEPEGWRAMRQDGGEVIHVPSGETVAGGLSMPHSPRWHQGKLWLHRSGTGEFGHVDLDTGRFIPVAFCPGYLRGLSFINQFAVIGLSVGRDDTFGSLPLQAALAERCVMPRCAIQIVDLNSGDIVHELRLKGDVRELYDTAVLPGIRLPATVGYMSEEFMTDITFRDPDV